MSILRFLMPQTRIFLSIDLYDSTRKKMHEMHATKKYRKKSTVDRTALEEDSNQLGALSQDWISDLAVFYRQFEKIYLDNWDRKKEDASLVKAADDTAIDGKGDVFSRMADCKPRLFKMLGDELIFTTQIGDSDEAIVNLVVWNKSIRDFTKFLKTRTKSKKIKVKCSAWFAGFPVTNQEIVTFVAGNEVWGKPL